MTDPIEDDQVLESFASLADTLVDDYDVVDLLQELVDTCQRLIGVAAAGILLADLGDQLDLVASTSEASRVVETMQLSAEAGPCVEAFHTGQVISVPDISLVEERWGEFAAVAIAQGFKGILAIPLRLRGDVIGTLNLLQADKGELSRHDMRAAQALADVATIGILHQRAFRESTVVREQLTLALESRVLIEQAKGVVSNTRTTTPEEAFAIIRNYARSNRMTLSGVADLIVRRELQL